MFAGFMGVFYCSDELGGNLRQSPLFSAQTGDLGDWNTCAPQKVGGDLRQVML